MSGSLAILLVVAFCAGRARADVLEQTLDQLVATQRPAGGWTFWSPPGRRPEPFTFVVATAEHWLAPLGLATWDLVVVRSPGTPAAGLALLEGWRRTGRPAYLDAARRAGDLLAATQLAHGGWFSELPVVAAGTPWWFRATADTRAMLDDDVTPGAVRFLLALWQVTGDPRHRAAAERGLALMQAAQLPSGAWPLEARPAWQRRWRPQYVDLPSLNDGATSFVVDTFLEAARLLDRDDLLQAARRGGDWMLAVQGRPPHAGWAQQYDADGRPATARRFEVPALASWESRHAAAALVALAGATGDRRYCDGALAAARWLDAVRVGESCWARLYDVDSGAPIFVDAAGRRVDSSVAARPHYAWMGDFGIPHLLGRLGLRSDTPPARVPGDSGRCPEDRSPPPPLAGARVLTADAVMELERLAPDPAPAACAPDGVR